MDMHIEFANGQLKVDLYELLRRVDIKYKQDLIEVLACDDEVIGHVTEQIITGWTVNASSGGSFCRAQEDPQQFQGLDWAWRAVAKASGEIAKREIERLEAALTDANKRATELSYEVSDMRRRNIFAG